MYSQQNSVTETRSSAESGTLSMPESVIQSKKNAFVDNRPSSAVQRVVDNRTNTTIQLKKFNEEALVINGSRLAAQHIRPWGSDIETLMTNSSVRSDTPSSKSNDEFEIENPPVFGAVKGIEDIRESHNNGRTNSVMMITKPAFHKEFLKEHGNKEFAENTEFSVPGIHFITVQNAPKRGGFDIDKGAARISFDKKGEYHHLEGFVGKRPVPANSNLLWKK